METTELSHNTVGPGCEVARSASAEFYLRSDSETEPVNWLRLRKINA